jgi:hypothetical protein
VRNLSLDLAAAVWKECRQFILDSSDKREAADHVISALMEHASAGELRDAFKLDGVMKMAIADALGEYEDEDIEEDEDFEDLDPINEDGEFDYDEY